MWKRWFSSSQPQSQLPEPSRVPACVFTTEVVNQNKGTIKLVLTTADFNNPGAMQQHYQTCAKKLTSELQAIFEAFSIKISKFCAEFNSADKSIFTLPAQVEICRAYRRLLIGPRGIIEHEKLARERIVEIVVINPDTHQVVKQKEALQCFNEAFQAIINQFRKDYQNLETVLTDIGIQPVQYQHKSILEESNEKKFKILVKLKRIENEPVSARNKRLHDLYQKSLIPEVLMQAKNDDMPGLPDTSFIKEVHDLFEKINQNSLDYDKAIKNCLVEVLEKKIAAMNVLKQRLKEATQNAAKLEKSSKQQTKKISKNESALQAEIEQCLKLMDDMGVNLAQTAATTLQSNQQELREQYYRCLDRLTYWDNWAKEHLNQIVIELIDEKQQEEHWLSVGLKILGQSSMGYGQSVLQNNPSTFAGDLLMFKGMFREAIQPYITFFEEIETKLKELHIHLERRVSSRDAVERGASDSYQERQIFASSLNLGVQQYQDTVFKKISQRLIDKTSIQIEASSENSHDELPAPADAKNSATMSLMEAGLKKFKEEHNAISSDDKSTDDKKGSEQIETSSENCSEAPTAAESAAVMPSIEAGLDFHETPSFELTDGDLYDEGDSCPLSDTRVLNGECDENDNTELQKANLRKETRALEKAALSASQAVQAAPCVVSCCEEKAEAFIKLRLELNHALIDFYNAKIVTIHKKQLDFLTERQNKLQQESERAQCGLSTLTSEDLEVFICEMGVAFNQAVSDEVTRLLNELQKEKEFKDIQLRSLHHYIMDPHLSVSDIFSPVVIQQLPRVYTKIYPQLIKFSEVQHLESLFIERLQFVKETTESTQTYDKISELEFSKKFREALGSREKEVTQCQTKVEDLFFFKDSETVSLTEKEKKYSQHIEKCKERIEKINVSLKNCAFDEFLNYVYSQCSVYISPTTPYSPESMLIALYGENYQKTAPPKSIEIIKDKKDPIQFAELIATKEEMDRIRGILQNKTKSFSENKGRYEAEIVSINEKQGINNQKLSVLCNLQTTLSNVPIDFLKPIAELTQTHPELTQAEIIEVIEDFKRMDSKGIKAFLKTLKMQLDEFDSLTETDYGAICQAFTNINSDFEKLPNIIKDCNKNFALRLEEAKAQKKTLDAARADLNDALVPEQIACDSQLLEQFTSDTEKYQFQHQQSLIVTKKNIWQTHRNAFEQAKTLSGKARALDAVNISRTSLAQSITANNATVQLFKERQQRYTQDVETLNGSLPQSQPMRAQVFLSETGVAAFQQLTNAITTNQQAFDEARANFQRAITWEEKESRLRSAIAARNGLLISINNYNQQLQQEEAALQERQAAERAREAAAAPRPQPGANNVANEQPHIGRDRAIMSVLLVAGGAGHVVLAAGAICAFGLFPGGVIVAGAFVGSLALGLTVYGMAKAVGAYHQKRQARQEAIVAPEPQPAAARAVTENQPSMNRASPPANANAQKSNHILVGSLVVGAGAIGLGVVTTAAFLLSGPLLAAAVVVTAAVTGGIALGLTLSGIGLHSFFSNKGCCKPCEPQRGAHHHSSSQPIQVV